MFENRAKVAASTPGNAWVYVYDVADIVHALGSVQAPLSVLHGWMGHNALIDGFFHHALHSFQFLGIRDYREVDYTTEVLSWFNDQEWAASALYHRLTVGQIFAGHETIVVRRQNTLWLFVIV